MSQGTSDNTNNFSVLSYKEFALTESATQAAVIVSSYTIPKTPRLLYISNISMRASTLSHMLYDKVKCMNQCVYIVTQIFMTRPNV